MGNSSHNPNEYQSTATEATGLDVRVVEAVASAMAIDPTECPVLYDAVDPEALNDLFEREQDARSCVTFEYAGYLVTVDSAENITLAEPAETY